MNQMDKAIIENALTAISDAVASIQAEIGKESGAEAPTAPGNPGEMATPPKPAAGGVNGLAAFMGR